MPATRSTLFVTLAALSLAAASGCAAGGDPMSSPDSAVDSPVAPDGALPIVDGVGSDAGSVVDVAMQTDAPPVEDRDVVTPVADGSVDDASTPDTGTPSTGTPWDPRELPTDPELPREQVAIPAVPAGAPRFRVTNEATLRAALASARPGDKIEIENSFTISDRITLPDPGAGSEYIVIYSAGWDTSPPVAFGENTGAVAHVTAATPMFSITTGGNGAFDCAAHAHHYHFVGLEFLYDPSVTTSSGLMRMYDQTLTSAADQPHHLIVDRCRLRGFATPAGPSRVRGVIMNADYSAVHQSYLDGFLNTDSDGQAIASWSSRGPLRITNNFLEGASETIILGGADAAFTGAIPSDVEIRFNHLYKRQSWLGNGHTKNLFEIKFARRVLVESNILENYRTDQQTSAVNIKINSAGATTPAETDHITLRYNVFRRIDSGLLKIASVVDTAEPLTGTHDVLFAHNYVDGAVNPTFDGWFFQFLANPSAPMDLISIRNNTVLGARNTCIQMQAARVDRNFVFVDNICSLGAYGVKAGGVTSGTASLDAMAPGSYTFTGNVLVGMPGTYPSGNPIASDIGSLGLVSWNATGGSNVALSSTSPYRGMGTGGRDPGVNSALVDARVMGVAYTPEVP